MDKTNKALARIKAQPQLLLLVAMVAVCMLAVPRFGTSRNMLNILKTIATTSIIGCGMAVVLIGGNLDLSVGSVFSLLCVVSMRMQNTSVLLGIVVPFAFAMGVGVINGFLIYKFKINSIIVTLGTMSIFSGVALLYSNSSAIAARPGTSFDLISGTSFLGIPSYVYIFFLVALLLEVLIKRTSFGRSLYLQGTNRQAAEIAGINVSAVTILSMVICSCCVAVAAIIQCSRVGSAYPISGVGMEFNALAGVLLGGVSLSGGKGNVLKTIVGALLLQTIVNSMILLDITHEWQDIVKSLLIIIAIIFTEKTRLDNEND